MAERPPNLLVVMADQLRRQALGAYGDPNVSTPHIDGLASSGVRFDRACSTYPVCVPFRFSLMTGEYAHSRSVPAIEWRLSPAERTLAHEFNDAGYETIYVGKWHLYGGMGGVLPNKPPGFTSVKANRTPVPREHRGGWQKWLAFEVGGHSFDTCYFEDDDPIPRPITSYQTDGLFDLAMNHLGSGRDATRPFCCVVSVEPPHNPYLAPESYVRRWRDREPHLRANVETPARQAGAEQQVDELLEDHRGYYAMIENLDDNVGRMVQFLRERNLADDTVIIVLSDHGDLLGSHGILSKYKQYPYEESVGIPLIVHDPRSPSRHGTALPDAVATEDLYPTLLGLAGLTPSRPKPGADLAPLVRGELAGLDRPGVLLEFVSEYRKAAPFHEQTWRAFCSARYKYVVLGDAAGGEPWLFFDLEMDPYEQVNLIDDPGYKDEITEHHRLLRERMLSTGDHYVLKPAYGFDGLNDWSWPPGNPVRS